MTPPSAAVVTPALELQGITKRFGELLALDDVHLRVERGEVHALLGENGAGKTTLMRVAYGLLACDAGTIRVFGREYSNLRVREAVRAGVGMVQQHLSLVPTLTAAENLALGGTGRFSEGVAGEQLRAVSAASGLAVAPGAMARDLSIVERQRLEILKALARDARLLILDEPTAVLAPPEIDGLLRWIRAFAESGGSVVVITHKLREVLAVADVVTVLRRGRVVHTGSARDATEQALARAMFPEIEPGVVTADERPSTRECVAEAVGMDVTDPESRRGVHEVSFRLNRGDIVGVAAVEGSGHREMLLALARLLAVRSGSLRLPDRIALVPADRARDALIPEFTLVENVGLRNAGTRRGLMPWQALRERTDALIGAFDIQAAAATVSAGSLSGGNQQRLVIARELEEDVDLVVADNPTRGLDLRSATFVHARLRDAAARGAAVVLHSSDLDEVLELCTRILVVFRGGVRDVRPDAGEVGRAMVGAT